MPFEFLSFVAISVLLQFEILGFVTIKVLEFCCYLSIEISSQFVLLSFVLFGFLIVATSWFFVFHLICFLFFQNISFLKCVFCCHNFRFRVFSQLEYLSFLKVGVFEFCQNLSFWVLSMIEFLNFVTIWLLS